VAQIRWQDSLGAHVATGARSWRMAGPGAQKRGPAAPILGAAGPVLLACRSAVRRVAALPHDGGALPAVGSGGLADAGQLGTVGAGLVFGSFGAGAQVGA
jgi:hypothetical protein